MKKFAVITLSLALSAMSFAANYTPGQWSTSVPGGVTPTAKGFTIDKLGAHQNGGRGCVGCHAPHSSGRGNGGLDAGNQEVLWGEDLSPIYGTTLNFPGGDLNLTAASSERLITGVAMCLSCHDGNVAKGAMMTNMSFEQAAGMLPATYGTNTIPTLLGNDGSTLGNYENDHPVGPVAAKLGGLSGINAATNYLQIATNTAGVKTLAKGSGFAASAMEEFYKNYGLPTIVDARAGAGFAIDDNAVSVDDAYVVCTTCHTPHSMYTTSAKLNGVSKGTVPTFFFIAAGYNPGANTANGTKASSATQFCRQCHFSGAGGSNEASGISIPTAF